MKKEESELAKMQGNQLGKSLDAFRGLFEYSEKEEKKSWRDKMSFILACIAFLISLFSLLLTLYIRSGYCIDEVTFKKQLEQKICKIKKDTPIMIKHWDGTEFYITFVESPKDQPDVILVRIWGKVLPMEKGLIEEVKKR